MKNKESIVINNNIVEGFSIEEIEDLLTDEEGKEQDNEELDSMIRSIAGLGTVLHRKKDSREFYKGVVVGKFRSRSKDGNIKGTKLF